MKRTRNPVGVLSALCRLALLGLLAVLCLVVIIASGCDPGDAEAPDDSKNAAVLSADTVILTVGGYPVYWPEFRYWLKVITDYYKDANALDTITDWTVQQNGGPLEEFFLSAAVDYAGRHRALERHAAEMGVEVSEAQLAEIAKARTDNLRIYGSETEYVRIVSQMYMSEDVYTYLMKTGYLSTGVFTQLYGANGENCTDEDVAAYVAQQGLKCARYVFLSDTGTGTAELGDAEKQANRVLLEDLRAQLDASDDPAALLEALVEKYNEDPKALGYPDGVLFVTGGMGDEFERAFAALGDNEYSGIVQTEAGLYLILRLPLDPDMTADSAGSTLRYRAAYDYLFQNQVNAWYAEMEVEYTDAYKTLVREELID